LKTQKKNLNPIKTQRDIRTHTRTNKNQPELTKTNKIIVKHKKTPKPTKNLLNQQNQQKLTKTNKINQINQKGGCSQPIINPNQQNQLKSLQTDKIIVEHIKCLRITPKHTPPLTKHTNHSDAHDIP